MSLSVALWHGGYWQGLQYVNGVHEVINLERLTYKDLLRSVHAAVQSDMNYWFYVIHSLVETNGVLKKKKIKTDSDVQDCFTEQYGYLVIFITLKRMDVGVMGGSGETEQGGESLNPFIEEVRNLNWQSVPIGLQDNQDFYSRWGINDCLVGTSSNVRWVTDDGLFGTSSNFQDLNLAPPEEIQEPGPTDHDHRNFGADDFVLDEEVEAVLDEDQRAAYEQFCDGIMRSEWHIPDVPEFGEPTAQIGQAPTGLKKGALFGTKDELKSVVGYYHLENQVQYRVDHSDKHRWAVVCNQNDCPFLLTAAEKLGVWKIAKVVLPHTCSDILGASAPRRLPSSVIGDYFIQRLWKDKSDITPREIRREMTERYKLNLSYKQARQVRRHAMYKSYGDPITSFHMLPAYLEVLKERNPGTYTAIDTQKDGKFKNVFFALGASIAGFRQYSRPVIVVDGCHLKGQYRGIGFVAVTKDGNDQIFPIAIGIGNVENDESWTWFLKQVREAVGCPDGLVIVSDQHVSIGNAIESAYPEASHALCCFHLQQNLAKYGGYLVGLFHTAAYCYDEDTFNKCMSSINGSGYEGAIDSLIRAGATRWSRVKCPVRRFNFMTSNAAEVWNARLIWARKLPVCSFLEAARRVIEKWFVERRLAAEDRGSTFTKSVHDKLSEFMRQGQNMEVERMGRSKLKVTDGHEIHLVGLSDGVCSCMFFQTELMPCAHACAAICAVGEQVASYVAPYYTTHCLKGMWSCEVMPVPDPTEWVVADETRNRVCFAPDQPKQAGRPRSTRIPSTGEHRGVRRLTCSRCGETGHNCTTCTQYIPPQGGLFSANTDEDGQQSRRKKKCSICGSEEHNRRTCSANRPS